jgi:DHA2 family multidrug resistance protein
LPPASWLRVVQMLPLPFCFISITTRPTWACRRKQSNQVAGLINFARNIGGSILIAVTNAQVTSRSMWHEQHLQQAMQPGTPGFDQHVKALTGFSATFLRRGQQRITWRWPQIYNQLTQQAQTQGYQDVYMELGAGAMH